MIKSKPALFTKEDINTIGSIVDELSEIIPEIKAIATGHKTTSHSTNTIKRDVDIDIHALDRILGMISDVQEIKKGLSMT